MNAALHEGLWDAVITGNLVNLELYLSDKADVNEKRGKHSNCLLHKCVIPEVTRALISHGADVNATNLYGETPLHTSVTARDGFLTVQLLIKHGADVNCKNNYGHTPLHLAVGDKNNVKVVRELLKNGADVNATDNVGNSVLFIVVKYYKHLEVIKELMDFGADINIRSSSLNRFCTPIDVAVYDNDLSCATMLIRVTVLKHYDKNYKKISDLESYIRCTNKITLLYYLNACISEILLMRDHRVNSKYFLYEFIVKNDVKPLYLGNATIDWSILSSYYIYHDVISITIKKCYERALMLDTLSCAHVCIELESATDQVPHKLITLNGDCLYNIGEFLSHEDLLSFVIGMEPSFCLDKH